MAARGSTPVIKNSEPNFRFGSDTVEKLDFLPRSQFLRQQAGFKKKALRVRQKG
jgi:hypothetical protein